MFQENNILAKVYVNKQKLLRRMKEYAAIIFIMQLNYTF